MDKKKLSTYLCCFILFSFGIFLSVLGPLLPLITKSYSLALWQSGLLFSIHFLGFIIFVFLGGLLAEKYSKKIILNICLISVSLLFLLFGISNNILIAFIAIFFIGGSGGVIESLGCALISDINSDKNDYYINLGQAFICIGAALSPVLTFFIIGNNLSWRFVYYILSALFFLMFLVFAAFKIEETTKSERFRFSQLSFMIKDKKFLLVLITILLYAGTEIGTWGYMSTFFGEKLGLGLSGLLVTDFWIAMALGRLLCGKLIRYFEIRKIIVVLAFASAVTVTLSTISNNTYFAFAITFLSGFFFSSLYPFIMSMGAKRKNTSAAFSTIVAFGGIGTVIIPFSMGVIGEFISSNCAQLSMSVYLIIISIIYLTVKHGWENHDK
jgi:fucose permease